MIRHKWSLKVRNQLDRWQWNAIVVQPSRAQN